MTRRPLIALTASLNGTGPNDGAVQCPRAYVEAIEAAGGIPVVVAPQADTAAAATVVSRVDGLLCIGGPDLHPSRYGQVPHPKTVALDPRREAWDLRLLEVALLHEALPILGICLGLQELNVVLGGTLIQHLPDRGGPIDHLAPQSGDHFHGVRLRAGSRLAGVLGDGSPQVCTRHHQALDRIGSGLVVTAHADDGVVEAAEWGAEGRFVVGVQWHPERNAESPASQALFAAFVTACVPRRRQAAPSRSPTLHPKLE